MRNKSNFVKKIMWTGVILNIIDIHNQESRLEPPPQYKCFFLWYLLKYDTWSYSNFINTIHKTTQGNKNPYGSFARYPNKWINLVCRFDKILKWKNVDVLKDL